MNTTTMTLNPGYLSRLNWLDWAFALLAVIGTGVAFGLYHPSMDVYEKYILAGTLPAVIWLGWFWAAFDSSTKST